MQTVLTRKRHALTRFSSLMELYENNYMLVRLLIPELRQIADATAVSDQPGQRVVYVSTVEGCLDLELSAIEHSKYTTTFNLTYHFSNDLRNPREPDLTIRIYHDARTCEVMSGLLQGMKHGPLRRRDLHEGYRLNRFLSKWLRYCLRQGHGFHSEKYSTKYRRELA